MRKRAAALVLCLLLMLQITAPSVRAEQSVYFVAVGSNVLPLTDATMPFWSRRISLYLQQHFYRCGMERSGNFPQVPGQRPAAADPLQRRGPGSLFSIW